jgi:hypothetical protein
VRSIDMYGAACAAFASGVATVAAAAAALINHCLALLFSSPLRYCVALVALGLIDIKEFQCLITGRYDALGSADNSGSAIGSIGSKA